MCERSNDRAKCSKIPSRIRYAKQAPGLRGTQYQHLSSDPRPGVTFRFCRGGAVFAAPPCVLTTKNGGANGALPVLEGVCPDKGFDVGEEAKIGVGEGVKGAQIQEKTGVEAEDLADAPELLEIRLL